MNWTVRYSANFQKQAKKLPRAVVGRIDAKLRHVLAKTQNPQASLKSVEGYEGLWSYRVGNYRVLCYIYEEERMIVPIVIAHRATAYERISAERARPGIDEVRDDPTDPPGRWGSPADC